METLEVNMYLYFWSRRTSLFVVKIYWCFDKLFGSTLNECLSVFLLFILLLFFWRPYTYFVLWRVFINNVFCIHSNLLIFTYISYIMFMYNYTIFTNFYYALSMDDMYGKQMWKQYYFHKNTETSFQRMHH